ncbi:hypothetical protein LTR56_026752 [Elasticomyces elasticus]|nr:hypothetical protein LTR56_026752 [Elasticomyces elasticus]
MRPRPRPEQPDATDTRDARAMRGMDQAIGDIIRVGDEAKANADRFIEEGSVGGANRWVDRMKWAQYLAGHRPEALLDLIEAPDPDSEFVEAAIRSAMDGLGRISQLTVARKAGVFVRFEAIRSEEQQTRYVPLMAYQDYTAIQTYIRPWKQVLMFFARTRKAEERHKAPRTKPDRQKPSPQSTGRRRRRGNGNGKRRRDKDEDEGRDEEEVQRDQGEPLKALTAIQKACLTFCIALLDQKHIHHDYDSAMVCALAVLGVKSPGWKGVDTYSPILSKLIKVARFMVVQQAWEQVQPPEKFADERYETDGEDYGSGQDISGQDRMDDSGSGSFIVGDGDPSEFDMVSNVDSAIAVEPPEGKMGVVAAVREMMDRFMVRGTAGPMQWMLDLRTYGWKIHYNTTTPGHVQWYEPQTLTYKGMTIHMNAFHGFVHTVVDQTREFLRQRLLLGFEPPPILWQSMYDDPSNAKRRWNFLQDERFPWLADGRRWLWDQIRASPGQSEAWFDQKLDGMKRSRVDDYVDDVMEFRGLQLVAGHVAQGGGVPRAPEMLSIRHENAQR